MLVQSLGPLVDWRAQTAGIPEPLCVLPWSESQAFHLNAPECLCPECAPSVRLCPLRKTVSPSASGTQSPAKGSAAGQSEEELGNVLDLFSSWLNALISTHHIRCTLQDLREFVEHPDDTFLDQTPSGELIHHLTPVREFTSSSKTNRCQIYRLSSAFQCHNPINVRKCLCTVRG